MTTTLIQHDIGTVIRVDCGVDISAGTVFRLYHKKPGGSTGFYAGALYQTQHIEYITIADDIDEHGVWLIQAYVQLPSGTWRGDTAHITVVQAL